MQSSTENSHYVFDIGNHPTAVTCLPKAAEGPVQSLKWKAEAQSIHIIYGIVLRQCW